MKVHASPLFVRVTSVTLLLSASFCLSLPFGARAADGTSAAEATPDATGTPVPGPVGGIGGGLLYRATLAPDAAFNYIQLNSAERARYKFYARHMNETQRLEYLRRMRSDDREQYARDLGLPQLLETVPEPTRSEVVAGKVDLGMTPKQVSMALGDPAGKTQGAGALFGKSYKSWEKWSYQRSGGPFVVWFGNGSVVGFDREASPPADDSLPTDSAPNVHDGK
jgi:hypothetical protein